jgi:hypothetical protein
MDSRNNIVNLRTCVWIVKYRDFSKLGFLIHANGHLIAVNKWIRGFYKLETVIKSVKKKSWHKNL